VANSPEKPRGGVGKRANTGLWGLALTLNCFHKWLTLWLKSTCGVTGGCQKVTEIY